ncbi:hypothetical protein KBZ10_20080 [Streptomyces sp. F63]|uniref:hypothetical protein n=1 Tax=Streptomyces sp. F63 TaxID=2824887 RepID=UPI001B392E8D|nr:hypothetical protein [Streptomyces sp. F63]MBQ0986768.1 hypothetical protein [Streptomyces sp. F63]
MPERTHAPPAPAARPAVPLAERAEAALREAGPALLAYAAVRLTGLLVLAVPAAATGRDVLGLLSRRWDAVWYTRVAEHGYGFEIATPDGVHSSLAFFPLLPALERVLGALTPFDAPVAGLLTGWLASLAAAWGIYAIGAGLRGPATGVVLAALWGAYPTGFVQSMAYTETLFTAFAAWSLYAVLTGRWPAAGALAVLAGLTRPTAAALVAAVVVPAGVVLLRAWRDGAPPAALFRAHRPVLLGMLLAPLGWLSYLLFVAVREHDPFGYFAVQAAWGNGFDGGRALAGFVLDTLRSSVLAGLALCAALALVVWLLRLCVRQRQPLPLLVYSFAVVAVSLAGSGYFGSRPRLIMPAFPLLLPVAVVVARQRPARAALVCAVAAVASGVYGAASLLGPGPP